MSHGAKYAAVFDRDAQQYLGFVDSLDIVSFILRATSEYAFSTGRRRQSAPIGDLAKEPVQKLVGKLSSS